MSAKYPEMLMNVVHITQTNPFVLDILFLHSAHDSIVMHV